MNYKDVNDLIKIMLGKYKDNEKFLNSTEVEKKLEIQEMNLYYFQKSYESYLHILEIYADLVRKFRLENSLQISMLFTYLLWNGYFSVTGNHMYTDNRIALIQGLEAFDVMNGKGVCLGYSTMLRDFLIICGYDSANLLNIQDDNNKLNYVPKINRRQGRLKKITKIDEFISKIITGNIGNHVFTLINQDEKLYAYDPTNLTLISIENFNEAKIINGKGKFRLKPYISSMANLSENSTKVLKKLYSTTNFKNPYSSKYYSETFKALIQYLDENIDIIKEYYDLAFEDIKYVASIAIEEAKKR